MVYDPAGPVAPVQPPSQEGYFYVGSPGGPTQGGHTQGPVNASFGFQPGSPGFQATAGAYDATEKARQDALKKLSTLFSTGPVGMAAESRYMNPQGFDPRALEMQRRMAAELEAGSRGNALMRNEAAMHAKGFGNSASAVDSQSRIRTDSAANLNDQYSKLFIANEMAKQQEVQSAAQVLMSLYGLDAQTAMMYAQMQANYTAPVIPGVTPGPGGAPAGAGGHGTPPSPGAYWDPMVGGSGGWASR
jgi:hypothetical protein